MTDVEVLATGHEFIKGDVRAIEPVIEEIIRSAAKEIQITAYVFTINAFHILELIEEAAQRGIKVTMVVNNLGSQDKRIKTKLADMSSSYPHVKIKNFAGPGDIQQLHAKVVVIDRNRAVIGSANFSWNGMYGNYEIGLLVTGKAAWKLAKVIDILSD